MTNDSLDSLAEDADNMVRDLLRQVITESHSHSDEDIVSKALLFLLVRVSNTWRSIRTLRTHTEDDEGFMIDAGSLLRGMLDAYFQAEYLISEPSMSLQRANDYIDFEHVERYKFMTKVLGHDNLIARRLKKSPKRQDGEKAIRRNYDNVKTRFQRKPSSSSTRNHWYPGNLRDIATAIKKTDEYDTFLATFNGCVHSSASAVQSGPPIRAEHVLMTASTIAAKVTRLSVMHNKLILNTDYQRLLEVLCSSPDDEED